MTQGDARAAVGASHHSHEVHRGLAPASWGTAAVVPGAVATELARRCADNPQYSLRAFAFDLGTDHSSLSQLLRGRRVWTAATIERSGARLGLDTAAIEGFLLRERLADARQDHATVHQLETLSQYAAAVVTEWEHLALLEADDERDLVVGLELRLYPITQRLDSHRNEANHGRPRHALPDRHE